MIVDLPNSAVALAVADMCREKNKVVIGSGAGTALLTGAKCSPNTVHWTYDTYGPSVTRSPAACSTQGGKTWFFITADYAFGHDLEKQASDEVAGERRQGARLVRHPLGTATSPPSCCRRRPRAPRWSRSPTPAATPSTRSSRRPSSSSPESKRSWRLIFDLQSVPAIGLQTAQGLSRINALLLGYERRHARLVEALTRSAIQEDDAEPHAGGRLLRRAALSQGGRKGRLAGRWRSGRRRDEGHADRRCPLRQGPHPRRTGASCIRCTSCK